MTLIFVFKRKQKITALDISIFLRQFSTLISAGIPIVKSCDILEMSQEKRASRLLIYTIKKDMLAGKNLFSSLRRHTRYFDELTCQLVKIGEHTGQLDAMLTTIAVRQEKNIAFKNRLKQALFYPCMITVSALILTVSLFIFVIPRFAELFHDMQGKLPTFTVWIFYLSTELQQHIGWLAMVLFLFISMVFYSKRSPAFKLTFSHYLFQLPLLKSYRHKTLLAQFARNLAITYAAGIPITQALKLTANVSRDAEFTQTITRLRSKISAGISLHLAMEKLAYFPNSTIQMVKIGEESGTLDEMLNKIADFFESDIDRLLKNFCELLEPLIILILGVLIGGLIIGMYLPIFKLGSVL